jgi:RHS repeat-associated protein
VIEQDIGLANPVTFDYDYENRLVKITYTDTSYTEFTYDPLGRRLMTIEKDSSQQLIRARKYVYNGLNLIAELDDNDAVVASYTHGPGIDNLLSMRMNSTNFFYHTNHQGSITDITSISGTIIKQYRYDSYGNLILENGPSITDDFAYAGRKLHERSGLYYYRNRFYSPVLGRFITQDPIGLLGGANLYAYVGNDPANYIDPLGLVGTWPDWAGTGGLAVGGSLWVAGVTPAGPVIFGVGVIFTGYSLYDSLVLMPERSEKNLQDFIAQQVIDGKLTAADVAHIMSAEDLEAELKRILDEEDCRAREMQ